MRAFVRRTETKMTRVGWFVLALVALGSIGCDSDGVPEDAAVGDAGEDGDAGVIADDGGGTDGGSDAGALPDAGPCGGCSADTPICDVATNTCVGCLDDTDCAAPTPLCDPMRNTCAACLDDSECADDDRCTVDACTMGACTNDIEPMCVRQIEAGNGTSCVRHADGTVACWGNNGSGQLGDGTFDNRTTPVAMMGVTDAVDVSADFFHTCVVTGTGDVQCAGSHSATAGRLGIGSAMYDSFTTVQSIGFTDAVEVDTARDHSCARHRDGTVSCWGHDDAGELGNGLPFARTDAPVPVNRVAEAIGIAVGANHSCAVEATGFVSCWGLGASGQIGNDMILSTATPRFATLTGGVTVRAGGNTTCATLAMGDPVCWGANTFGQLGIGNTDVQRLPVSLGTPATDVGMGSANGCILRPSGQVSCAGRNFSGEVGDGTTDSTMVWRDVVGLADAIMLSVGNSHACAVRQSGAVVCWGGNQQGELGDGTTDSRSMPVGVVGYP